MRKGQITHVFQGGTLRLKREQDSRVKEKASKSRHDSLVAGHDCQDSCYSKVGCDIAHDLELLEVH